MEPARSRSPQLREKFQGCVVGALVGDCVGMPFELKYDCVPHSLLTGHLTELLEPEGKSTIEIQPYTDDTVMCWSVAESLIENQAFDPVDMAKRFTEEYYRNRNRNYGGAIPMVFSALRKSNYTNVFQPAQEQFYGTGSFGNGGAMRIAPVALFYCDDKDMLIKVARESSMITHAHRHGYNGAILQCLAVYQALKADPSAGLDPNTFLDGLLEQMEQLEVAGSDKSEDSTPFSTDLRTMKKVLEKKHRDLTPDKVAELFGNGEIAQKSVLTAVYAFLRSFQPLKSYVTDNPFLRTLYLAVSVGGDTDTIATMAGSIAGAYYGIKVIPDVLKKKCERWEYAHELAEKLYSLKSTEFE